MSYEKIRNTVIRKLDTGGLLEAINRILADPNIDPETYQKAFRLKAGLQIGIGKKFDFTDQQGTSVTDTSVTDTEVTDFINEHTVTSTPTLPDPNRLAAMNDLAFKRGLSMEQSQQLYDAYGGDVSTINSMMDDGLSVQDMLGNSSAELDAKGNEILVDAAGAQGSSMADAANAKAQSKTGLTSKTPNTLSPKAATAVGMVGEAVTATVNAVDNATMGDKNFSASSQAIDSAVHGVSGALMKSGNPYAMAAGAALEGLNFITKAGGKNVPGYDVNINNSGYGTMGHLESEAGRIWDNWNGNTARKLKKRNEQARMALAAADISEDQAFEQEARSNSVTNVLQANQIALAGGIDTSLLGS